MKTIIDWIEIPSSKFVFGLSKKQKEALWAQIWSEVAPLLDEPTRLHVTRIIDKRNKGDAHYTEEEISIMGKGTGGILMADARLRRQPDEQLLQLNSFYISKYPITISQFEEFLSIKQMQDFRREYLSPGTLETRSLLKPAIVDWHLAELFCQWMGARLPTETEWEKAARGTEGYLYPWGNQWDPDKGNFLFDSELGFTPVNRYPTGASPYDIFDMAGNALEWTSTIKSSPTRDYPVLKSWSVKQGTGPAWFLNIVAFTGLGGGYELGDRPEDICFRPVKDQWQNKYWSGW